MNTKNGTTKDKKIDVIKSKCSIGKIKKSEVWKIKKVFINDDKCCNCHFAYELLDIIIGSSDELCVCNYSVRQLAREFLNKTSSNIQRTLVILIKNEYIVEYKKGSGTRSTIRMINNFENIPAYNRLPLSIKAQLQQNYSKEINSTFIVANFIKEYEDIGSNYYDLNMVKYNNHKNTTKDNILKCINEYGYSMLLNLAKLFFTTNIPDCTDFAKSNNNFGFNMFSSQLNKILTLYKEINIEQIKAK